MKYSLRSLMTFSIRDLLRLVAFSLRSPIVRSLFVWATQVLMAVALAFVFLPLVLIIYLPQLGAKPVTAVLSIATAVAIAGVLQWSLWKCGRIIANVETDQLDCSGSKTEPPEWGVPPSLPNSPAPAPNPPKSP